MEEEQGYFDYMQKASRFILIYGNFVNQIYSTIGVISPGCTEERNMNIAYSINSIIIYYLTWKSLKKKA